MSDNENNKANVRGLRGQGGANSGPKLSQDKRESRKIEVENLAPTNGNGGAKGWKANR